MLTIVGNEGKEFFYSDGCETHRYGVNLPHNDI